ncbi:MAG: hypothetical protein ACRELB_16790 [Polyangiaceae bacterium]
MARSSIGRAARAGEWVFLQAFLAFALVAALFAPAGCSSSKDTSGGQDAGPTVEAGPACVSSKCAAGNQCIDDGSGSGPSCHKVCTQQSQCPFGWYCNDGALTGQPSWCVQTTAPIAKADGQWGTACLPGGGEGNNSACDTADGFICFGHAPTDATSYCTTQGCGLDTDCPGGWWCANVDSAPNVTTAKRSFGTTRTVCVPRDYCAPCQMDHDCSPSSTGTPQHCIQDQSGNGYCTPQCGSNADCALDATCQSQWQVCQPAEGSACKSDDDCPAVSGTFQHCLAGMCTPECAGAGDCGSDQQCQGWATCTPRAGTCVGDGGFCSPCRNDGDCTQGGTCVYTDYSTERYCSVPMSTGTCPTSTQQGVIINQPPAGSCPAAPAGSPASVPNKGFVGCTITKSVAPPNECVALTSISDGNGGETQVVGCWTANR